ncbi:hypothetical protein IPS96_22135, partial [Xanthomonas perforans]|nr:hypothetical protein [Xanthomonas perforans]
ARVGLFDKPDDLLGAESALLHVRPLGFTDFIASAGTAQWGQVNATLTDPPEWFLVLTDPPPYVFVCSGSTKEEAIQRAEKLGYSFEENPEPFPVGHQL